MRYLCAMALVVFLTAHSSLAEVWVESGPEGGAVTALVALPSSPDHLLCGLANGGLFRSSDGGEHWSPIQGLPEGIAIDELVVDPASGATIYAATEDGVFRSDDGGGTWTQLFDKPSATVAIDPTRSAVIAVGGLGTWPQQRKLWVSRNGGATWVERSPVGWQDTVGLAFSPDGNALYAVDWGFGQHWKSTDDGESWTVLGTPQSLHNFNVWGLRVVSEQHLYTYGPYEIHAPESYGGGVLESTDGGMSWNSLGAGEITALTVSPCDGMLFAGDQWGTLYRRGPASTAWDTLGVVGSEVRVILAERWDAGILTVGTLGGVYRTEDQGVTWQLRMGGIRRVPVTSVSAVGQTVAIGTPFNGVFLSQDAGQTWQNPFHPASPYLLTGQGFLQVWVAPSNPDVLYAGGWGLFKSMDGGQTWANVFPYGDPATLVIHPADPDRVVTDINLSGNSDVVRWAPIETYDGGRTWYGDTIWEFLIRAGPASPYIEAYFGGDQSFLDLEFDPAGQYAYAMVKYAHPELIKADLTTGSYEKIAFEGADGHVFRVLAIHPSDGNRVYAITVGSEGDVLAPLLWRSGDGGRTWRRSILPLAYDSVARFDQSSFGDRMSPVNQVSLLVEPVDPPRLFLAISGVGVLVSDDDGDTWRTINSGLPSLEVRGLAVTASGVSVATESGLFRLDNPTTVVEVLDADVLPERPVLFPNAPNPFNGTTMIRYTVSPPHAQHPSGRSVGRDQPMSMVLYNLDGQVVRNLMESSQGLGSYTVVWDGRDDYGRPVASGVYVYRLVAGSFAKSGKAVVLR